MAKAVPILKTGTILTRIVTTRIAKIKNKWFAHANHILFEQTLNGGLDVLLGDRGLNGFLQGQSRGIDAFHMGEACIE